MLILVGSEFTMGKNKDCLNELSPVHHRVFFFLLLVWYHFSAICLSVLICKILILDLVILDFPLQTKPNVSKPDVHLKILQWSNLQHIYKAEILNKKMYSYILYEHAQGESFTQELYVVSSFRCGLLWSYFCGIYTIFI